MLARSLKLIAFVLALIFGAAPVLASASAAFGNFPGAVIQLLRIQSNADLPQSMVSGPFILTVIEANQSPAIEGVTEDAAGGSDWVALVVDVANISASPATVALSEFALTLGDAATNPANQAVVVSDVNLRAGPGTDSAILTAVLEGTPVTLLGDEANGFLHVEALGQEGWIFADFVSSGNAGVSAPTTAAIDIVASQAVAKILNLDSTLQRMVAPGMRERIALAFPVAAGGQDVALSIYDSVLPFSQSQRNALSPDSLPDIAIVPQRSEAAEVSVVDGQTLKATVDGRSTTISLAHMETPVNNECFAQNAEDGLRALVGNGVWLEAVGDEYLVWTNDVSAMPQLVNYELVAKGLAATSPSGARSQFAAWLDKAEDNARAAELGLWAECTGIHGNKKPAPTPTPTPTPSPAEVRASYPVLPDVRELAIRPGNLVGDKVAFTGEILTIRVAEPGYGYEVGDTAKIFTETSMQVWVYAPDGSREAVVIGYDGDTTGMYEGTYVTVYGTVIGTASGTNMMGGEITQPLVKADIIDFA